VAKPRIVPVEFKLKGEKQLKDFNRSLRSMDNSLKQSSRSLKTLEQNSQRTAKALGAATGILVGFVTGRGFSKIVEATVKQEQAIAQLEAAIASTGNASGRSSEQLQAYASELQRIGVEGDEAVLGVQSLLLTFKQIEGDTFDRTTRAVLDLSVAMNQDLKSSAVQLGKALNDPIANLGALSRTGIQFAEDQKELIKQLAATGRVAEAQAIILTELESQFGGSAAAARNTLGGALKALQNNFGDLFEASGPGLDSLTESINDVADIFADPSFQENVQKVVGEILRLGGTGAEVFANFGNIVGFVRDEFAALFVLLARMTYQDC
jgi:phage-related minor tail protein